MKLIKKPTLTVEQVPVIEYLPTSKIRNVLTLGRYKLTEKDIKQAYNVPGKVTTTDAVIDFEVATDPDALLGVKIDCVLIGNNTLFGVVPMVHLRDDVYQCTVDCW